MYKLYDFKDLNLTNYDINKDFLKLIKVEAEDILKKGYIEKSVFFIKRHTDGYEKIFGEMLKNKNVKFTKNSPHVAFDSRIWNEMTLPEKIASIKWYNEKLSKDYGIYEPAIVLKVDKRQFLISPVLNLGLGKVSKEHVVGKSGDTKRLVYMINLPDLEKDFASYDLANMIKITSFKQMIRYFTTKKYHNLDINIDKNLKRSKIIRPDFFTKKPVLYNEKDEAISRGIKRPIHLKPEQVQKFTDLVSGYIKKEDLKTSDIASIVAWGVQPLKLIENELADEVLEEMTEAKNYIGGANDQLDIYYDWKKKEKETIDELHKEHYNDESVYKTYVKYLERPAEKASFENK